MTVSAMGFIEDLPMLLIIGAIAGYFMGYVIKKLLHLAFIIGIFVFLFGYMAATDVINLNFEKIISTVSGYIDVLGRLGFAELAFSGPFTGSFALGLLFGFMKS